VYVYLYNSGSVVAVYIAIIHLYAHDENLYIFFQTTKKAVFCLVSYFEQLIDDGEDQLSKYIIYTWWWAAE
jgi:hypothetical protein